MEKSTKRVFILSLSVRYYHMILKIQSRICIALVKMTLKYRFAFVLFGRHRKKSGINREWNSFEILFTCYQKRFGDKDSPYMRMLNQHQQQHQQSVNVQKGSLIEREKNHHEEWKIYAWC